MNKLNVFLTPAYYTNTRFVYTLFCHILIFKYAEPVMTSCAHARAPTLSAPRKNILISNTYF